jgi:hypothetical protein
MFDSYSFNPKQCLSINAVTGAILKNHPKSWFERFHLKSKRAENLLCEGGHQATKQIWKEEKWMSSGGYNATVRDSDKDITVLQMVICGDMEVMAELVYTNDYKMQGSDING